MGGGLGKKSHVGGFDFGVLVGGHRKRGADLAKLFLNARLGDAPTRDQLLEGVGGNTLPRRLKALELSVESVDLTAETTDGCLDGAVGSQNLLAIYLKMCHDVSFVHQKFFVAPKN